MIRRTYVRHDDHTVENMYMYSVFVLSVVIAGKHQCHVHALSVVIADNRSVMIVYALSIVVAGKHNVMFMRSQCHGDICVLSGDSR